MDFNYEVSRSLKACEGFAGGGRHPGYRPQTLANAYLAVENDLEIVPVINKIDLVSADIEMSVRKSRKYWVFPQRTAPNFGKNGINITDVLKRL